MGSFSFKRRAKSFLYAFRGAKHLLSTQHNAWIHAVATVVRIFVSEVGFVATWWVGLFSGWLLAGIAVPVWPG